MQSYFEDTTLVLTTSNFPTNGIVDRVSAMDTIGRISSRLKEMAFSAIELTGPDYRDIIADRRKKMMIRSLYSPPYKKESIRLAPPKSEKRSGKKREYVKMYFGYHSFIYQ